MRYIAISLALGLCACTASTTPASVDPSRAQRPTSPAEAPEQTATAKAAESARTLSVVPAQYHGEWNRNSEHCGTGTNDSSLRIGPDKIEYHESHGPIKAAVANGQHELALIVELSGEGETWLTTEHFKLSARMDELSSVNGVDEPIVRHRCEPRRE